MLNWKDVENLSNFCTACDTLVILVDKQINELIKKNPCKRFKDARCKFNVL